MMLFGVLRRVRSGIDQDTPFTFQGRIPSFSGFLFILQSCSLWLVADSTTNCSFIIW